MRFLSSAGARFSHSVFGTTPNMAPPSSLKKPSKSGINSRSPNFMDSSRPHNVALHAPTANGEEPKIRRSEGEEKPPQAVPAATSPVSVDAAPAFGRRHERGHERTHKHLHETKRCLCVRSCSRSARATRGRVNRAVVIWPSFLLRFFVSSILRRNRRCVHGQQPASIPQARRAHSRGE